MVSSVKRKPAAALPLRKRRKEDGPACGVFVQNAPRGTDAQARFSNEHFAEGGFRHVYKGVYLSGPREGEECVMKEFKTGSVHEATFFEADVQAVKKATRMQRNVTPRLAELGAGQLIQKFNDANVVSKPVYLNEPEVWSGSGGRIAGHKVLVEPMIRGTYFRFNSNTGYAEPDTATMQALSHFSYHISNGQYLLCDLQGGRYDGFYILTDPVIHSKGKEFGGTDLGQEGIENFMAHHRCGRFCDPNWKLPPAKKLIPRFEAVAGTTFGEAAALFTKEQRRDLEIKVSKEVRVSIRKLWEGALPSDKKQIVVDKSKRVTAKVGPS